MLHNYPISGPCSVPAVRDAFAQNFMDDLELGASFTVIKDDDVIIDLVGGYTDRKKTREWDHNTLVPVYSSTKLVTAIIIAHLCDQDKIGYNQKIASFWQEFGANGKDKISIAQALSHQAGLSGITNPNWTVQDWFDWDKTCAELAAQAPIWEPGTASGYHPVTYGYLAGEIAKRTDGRTIGTILREDFCQPLDIDFMIGTPESEHARCADLMKPRSVPDIGEMNPATKAAFAQKWSSPGGMGMAAWRTAEFPAANGHGTAKALATLAGVLNDGKINGQTFLAEDMVQAVAKTRISGPNLVLPFNLDIAAGVMNNTPNHFYGPNDKTLGHSGWGGSCVFADPDANLSCAYIMNRQSHHLIGDPRPMRLIEALYEGLA